MKKIKFIFILFTVLFASAFFNETNAANTLVSEKLTKQIKYNESNNKEPDIIILYIYEYCYDGTQIYVGNIGFMDDGTPIGMYYWGIGDQCDDHGPMTQA